MSFEVGRLSAALTLDGIHQFHQELDGVGRKFSETAQKGSAFGRAGETAVRAAAGATTGLVTAATAYLTILTKTGVAYNSLQQNSRAALSVLLGGTEQANAQMRQLDDFARNSPFSKSVFIQAQQQLIGFGMEAGKVIPTLDAIQQGVAAMGGSNEQISEVVNILAKVQSTGKFTAETLNELGYRGVDAATLMGNAMGKSAAQMREDISKGAIGGAEAIDVLVDAMQTRFGGAADGVKEQWTGALDRIKAAQRDLGAHLAEPFVSAQGGGMAVTWGNQVADVLRAIEKQAVPVMGILTQRGMPFFAGLTQGLDSARMSIQRWDASSLEQSLDRLAGHAPGIAALAGATLALGAQVGPLGKMLTALNVSANPLLAAFVGLAAASPELRAALGDLLAAGKPLLPMVGELATILSNSLNAALPLAATGVELLTAVLRPVLSIVSGIPAPVLAGAAAFLAMHKATSGLQAPLMTIMSTMGQSAAIRAFNAGLTPTSALLAGVSSTAGAARAGVVSLGNALKTAFLSNPIGIALTVVAAAIGAWAMANAAAQQKVEEHRSRVAALKDTLDETTGALTEASEAQVRSSLEQTKAGELADKIGVSYRDVEQAVLGNGEAYERVTEAVDRFSTSISEGDKNSSTWERTNRDGRAAISDLTGIIEEHRASVEDAQRAKREMIAADREAAAAMTDAARSNQRFNDALQVARDITQDAETRVRALKQALDELKGGAISAEEAQKRLSETNLTLAEGLAQTDEAGAKLWQATLDGAGKIDLGSRAGLAFADSMARSRDAMLNAAMAASDQALANGDLVGAVSAAREAGEGYISTLRATMEDAELTKEQIDGLVGSYLDVPGVVATILTDNGTISEVDQQVLALAMQLDGVPDGKTIEVSDPGNPEVIKRLEEAGVKVEQIPGSKNIHISQTGADVVAGVLDRLSETRHATVLIHQVLTGRTNSVEVGNSNGGLYSGRGRHFADGGFASGIYAGVMGGIPKMGADGLPHLFAEKHLGVDWETYISSRASRERNAMLLMETARRIGFPVIPLSALQGIRGYADGGTAARGGAASTLTGFGGGSVTNWNITQMYPQHTDPMQDMSDLADELAAAWKGGL